MLTWRAGPNGENRGYSDLSFAKMDMSPSRKRIAVSQPGRCTVTVCGPSGGHECPNSAVMGLKVAITQEVVAIGLEREVEDKGLSR